jgi:hypothetical protein
LVKLSSSLITTHFTPTELFSASLNKTSAGIAAARTLVQRGQGSVSVQLFDAGAVLGGRASRGTVRTTAGYIDYLITNIE